MGLEDQISDEIKNAMRAKETEKLMVLRGVKAMITNLKIQKQSENLAESDILGVIEKQAKQRKESMESFKTANRMDLYDKEKQEFEMLCQYLPKQLTEAEIKVLVLEAIKETNSKTKAEAGNVMKALMPKVKGKADGKLVNQCVMAELV
jgi:uncharacterized protein YqeY